MASVHMVSRYTTPSAFHTRYVACPLQDLTKISIVSVVNAACPEKSKSPHELKSPTLPAKEQSQTTVDVKNKK